MTPDPLVCGYAVGKDHNAETEDEACGKEFTNAINWLNHLEVDHRDADTVACRRCGEDTGRSEKHGPKISFFDDTETTIVCFDCQNELFDELNGWSE